MLIFLGLGYLTQDGFFFLSSLYLHANFKMSFFLTAEYFSIVHYISFINFSVEGHLGYFQVLAITDNTAMNIVEQMSL